MFTKLTEEQIQDKIKFIKNYIKADNAADGSSVDANANVSTKTVVTLESESNKDIAIQTRREILYERIQKLFGDDEANRYKNDLEKHYYYVHDETSGNGCPKPYCSSITLYPFLDKGTKPLGGNADPPKHLRSFCGGYINLMYLIASNFAGACHGAGFCGGGQF